MRVHPSRTGFPLHTFPPWRKTAKPKTAYAQSMLRMAPICSHPDERSERQQHMNKGRTQAREGRSRCCVTPGNPHVLGPSMPPYDPVFERGRGSQARKGFNRFVSSWTWDLRRAENHQPLTPLSTRQEVPLSV